MAIVATPVADPPVTIATSADVTPELHATREPRVPASASFALIAALMVAIGSSIRGPLTLIMGLPVTAAGLAVASRAMWLAGRRSHQGAGHWLSPIAICLFVMAAIGLVGPSLDAPLWFQIAHRGYFAAGLIAVAIVARGTATWRTRAMWTMTITATIVHLMMPLAIPRPPIDVWSWTQTCARALLAGVHPYTIHAGDILDGATYAGQTAVVYPYMPLTLLVFVPAVLLFGDCRFLSALCVPATTLLNRAAGRRLRLDPLFMDAVTLAFLLHPRSLSLTWSGWTEPLMVVCAAAFVYLAIRAPEGAAQAIAFFLLPMLKQYFLAPVAMYLMMKPPRPRWSIVALAIGAALATVVPFLIWNGSATMDGITFQMIGPLRPRLRSTSFVALQATVTGHFAGRWLSVATQIIVGGIAYGRLRRHGLAGLLLASAIALLATFLAGWQAFVNYYYFVGELLLLSAIVMADHRHDEPEHLGATLDGAHAHWVPTL